MKRRRPENINIAQFSSPNSPELKKTLSSESITKLINTSKKTTDISCLIQKSLEHLLKKENYVKNPNLSNMNFRIEKPKSAKSSNIKMGNLSAEYDEILFHKSDYAKFKENYNMQTLTKNGFFLYSDNEKNKIEYKKIMERIENKSLNWKAEKNFKKLMNVQDNIEKAERINKNQKVKMISEIKQKSYSILDESLKRQNREEIINQAKKQIEINSHEVNELAEKLNKENETFEQNQKHFKDLTKELQKENEILHQKNQFIMSQYENMKEKYDKLFDLNRNLEKFYPSYVKLQESFPTYSVEKIIDKLNYLENINMNMVKKISDFDDYKRMNEIENREELQKLENKIIELSVINQKNEKIIENLRRTIQIQESDLLNNDNYKQNYMKLFQKILYIFNIWSNKTHIYFNPNDDNAPRSKAEDPLEMLDIIEKMIDISTDKNLQCYLRKIIVQANVLQRKFFPEYTNDKFNPEKIYERIEKFINQLQGELIKSKTENNNLKIALENKKRKDIIKKGDENKKALLEKTKLDLEEFKNEGTITTRRKAII